MILISKILSREKVNAEKYMFCYRYYILGDMLGYILGDMLGDNLVYKIRESSDENIILKSAYELEDNMGGKCKAEEEEEEEELSSC
jgi:hypothetical protein